MKRGIIDYLETLQMAGITDWGPFAPPDAPPVLVYENAENVVASSAENSEPENQVADKPVKNKDYQPELESTPISQMPRKKSVISQENDRNVALSELTAEVAKCKKCKELVANRTQTVFGVGNPYAELVFVGEAPGADEDKQGVPFVGRAGQLLTDMITKGMKINREDVYICNILRCRPPGNRNPSPDEAKACRHFLDRTLEVIQPKFICCLGAVAAQNLLGTEETIGKLRGRVLQHAGAKVICTYHPAYLLRNPSAKGATWEDLQLLMKEMGLPIR
ncbi:MAG: uracil-DNA glycosylase [Thermoguttaceae bacterium]